MRPTLISPLPAPVALDAIAGVVAVTTGDAPAEHSYVVGEPYPEAKKQVNPVFGLRPLTATPAPANESGTQPVDGQAVPVVHAA